MIALKVTQDRKTANFATPNGKGSKIANAFSLPAGRHFSCPGATTFCNGICYAGRLEKQYKGFKGVVMHNWELLKDAEFSAMVILLNAMIVAFEAQCDKWDAPKKFRIHADGDFFNMEYTRAWARVIRIHPNVHFWAYTRSDFAAEYLHAEGFSNLGLYFSADTVNLPVALAMEAKGIRLAMVDTTFDKAKESVKGVRCPEQNSKAFALINENGGACVRCNLCPMARGNVLFSVTKK
jgi:hypothetical protein